MQTEGWAGILLIIGIILLLTGFVVLALSRLGITGFRLPGDISICGKISPFSFLITTMLLISLVLTLIFNLPGRK